MKGIFNELIKIIINFIQSVIITIHALSLRLL
jgi:hypothetical protein